MADRRQLLLVECTAGLDEIRQTLQDVSRFLSTCPIPQGQAHDLDLVLAEVMTNIARHGYPGKQGTISLRLDQTPGALECRIADQGASFDPSLLGCTPPDPVDLREGGYGWFIIRSIARQVRYERMEGENILLFSVPLENAG